MNRILLVIAGLLGALGVAASAAGSHGTETNLSTAGTFLLLHAAALVGLGAWRDNRLATNAGWILAVGVILFAGDLAMRARAGTALFPMAAPIGGGAMILGWLAVAAAGLWRQKP
ncbi:MAG: DUF423 domain-containing protein [Hyphomicrobiales bacterium]|nr:MAG: DUF423 domain-containing protein [Hyphomicrobiales bacterium]